MSRHYIRLEVSDGPSPELAIGPEALVAVCARALHRSSVLLEGIEYLGPVPVADVKPIVHEVTGRDSTSTEVS